MATCSINGSLLFKKSETVSYPQGYAGHCYSNTASLPAPREKSWIKDGGSKDNKIEKVVSSLLIPDICSYFVKCKPKGKKKKRSIGKGHAFGEILQLYIGNVTKQMYTFAFISLKKGKRNQQQKPTVCTFLKCVSLHSSNSQISIWPENNHHNNRGLMQWKHHVGKTPPICCSTLEFLMFGGVFIFNWDGNCPSEEKKKKNLSLDKFFFAFSCIEIIMKIKLNLIFLCALLHFLALSWGGFFFVAMPSLMN